MCCIISVSHIFSRVPLHSTHCSLWFDTTIRYNANLLDTAPIRTSSTIYPLTSICKAENKLQASQNLRALSKDTRATVDNPVSETVLVDVVDDGLVVGTGLEPEVGNAESLGLLEEAESDLRYI